MSHYNSPSPPPLRHPVPTHPAYIPEPPSTPASPQGYQRFSSSPGPDNLPPQQQYSHVPAYNFQQRPPQPPQHQQQIHQPQPAQNQGSSFVPAASFGAWGMNDATAQFGLQLGSSAVAAGQDYMQKNFGGRFVSVKKNFDVSNSYVIQKLRLVLFPWRHKPWSRRILRSEHGQVEWQSPRHDLNSPDLYIPLMAFVTYILLCAFHSGLQDQFDPRILGESASVAFMVVLIDFCVMNLGCYILNVQGPSSLMDLMAYTGYKFVGVILMIVVGFVQQGRTLWYILFLYFFSANAFFLLRSLRSVVLPDPSINPNSTATLSPSQRRKRIIFLFLEAVFCQILYMFILVRV
ncbi:protein transporter yif1 [Mycena floridula]|nr:protein transporter yif1 [Mycena floridula]